MKAANQPNRPGLIDAHVHLYDNRVVPYGIFRNKDPGFEALVGDYSSLPSVFLMQDYLRATQSRIVEGIVWHEFISGDALNEAQWAERLASASGVPMALVALVDFADPNLARCLDAYREIPNLTAVRQHLGWDERHPLRRMAPRRDFMSDPVWLNGIDMFEGQDFRCGLEVFGPQLGDVLSVVQAHPDIGFTIAVMGWPSDLTSAGYARWRSDMAALGRCGNTCVSISAIECIFGLDWTKAQIEPWITAVVEAFSPSRCMFGSHLPIDALSYGFDRLYDCYDAIVASFSDDERDAMFRTTARDWFRVPL
jgi:predicted TIM-barrel fold metal-dependent hydrolase